MNHKIYFPNLDALRSVAALFVLFSHIISEPLTRYYPDAYWLTNPVTQFFIVNGGFGVQVFFSLSGFLITYLLLSEIKETNRFNLKNFYIRRLLRIWPVYFVVIFFVFIIYSFLKQLVGNDSPIHESALMYVLFLGNFDLIRILSDTTLYANGMLAVTWSVSVEEQFYLVWPLAIIAVGFIRIKYLILSVMGMGMMFMFLSYDDSRTLYYHTVSNFLFLGTGAMVAYLQIFQHKKLNILLSMSKQKWLTLIVSLLIVLIFTKEPLFSMSYGPPVYLLFVSMFLFCFLLISTENLQSPFEIRNIPFLVHMAKYTYGLYMYHRIAGFMLMTLMYKVLKVDQTFFTDLGVVFLQFIFTFLMAIVSYRFIEKPLLSYKNKFSIFHK